MVYQPAQPSEVKKKHKRSRVVQIILDALTLILVAGATYAIFWLTTVKPENQEANDPTVVNKVTIDQPEEEEDDPMWLNRTVSGWLEAVSRDFRVGVSVYDLDNKTSIGEAYADEVFTGQADSEMAARFGVGFATSGQTTAKEMVEILKMVYEHPGMSEPDWGAYKQMLLEQTVIYSAERCHGYCTVRDGLPAGFSESAKVYNENYMSSNGSFYLAYRDAAIVEFTKKDGTKRNFAMAVLGYGFSGQEQFKQLGERLDKAVTLHIENHE